MAASSGKWPEPTTPTGSRPPPKWFDAPAVGRLTVTSPRDLKPWKTYNEGRRSRAEQVKPANFLIIAHPSVHERARADGPRCLIAPFERDPATRLAAEWTDRDRPDQQGTQIRTHTQDEYLPGSTAVLSYGDYFDSYRKHPESKTLDPTDGKPCHTWTRGLLQPWHVRATVLRRVGKESNRLADTHLPADDETETVIEYPQPSRQCRGCDARVSGRQAMVRRRVSETQGTPSQKTTAGTRLKPACARSATVSRFGSAAHPAWHSAVGCFVTCLRAVMRWLQAAMSP